MKHTWLFANSSARCVACKAKLCGRDTLYCAQVDRECTLCAVRGIGHEGHDPLRCAYVESMEQPGCNVCSEWHFRSTQGKPLSMRLASRVAAKDDKSGSDPQNSIPQPLLCRSCREWSSCAIYIAWCNRCYGLPRPTDIARAYWSSQIPTCGDSMSSEFPHYLI